MNVKSIKYSNEQRNKSIKEERMSKRISNKGAVKE